MTTPKLLGISGSLRADSFNSKLVREAAQRFGPAEFSEGNLRLPLYDGDLEAKGIPAEVQTLADQIAAADAVIISSPEYNQSLTGVLKNALDWVSRVEGKPWQDKPVAIVAAAAGRSGGARGVYALRLAMMPFQAHVLPGPEVLVAGAFREFDEEGRLKGESYQEILDTLMAKLRAAATAA
ncbi:MULTISPECIES: NADPH-dependent FMN reductase [unclassified Dinoroseobacter]|uniref:NADPH-dependent FMN reductase n=1 Tax=unclassified Dinoroseobacter TaxID=2620028 RepID=UPI003C7C1AC2